MGYKLTPEQKAQVAIEEAALAAKHSKQQSDDEKHFKNQKKNARLYARSKKTKKGRAIIPSRQCKANENPLDYTLQDKEFTFFQVQYFDNTGPRAKRGRCNHILKIYWSTHSDTKQAKLKSNQKTTFFNLYHGDLLRQSLNKNFKNPDDKQFKSSIRTAIDGSEKVDGHQVQSKLFGFCTVQQSRHGTHLFKEHQALIEPEKDEQGYYLNVSFVINENQITLRLDEVYTGEEAQARFVGYVKFDEEQQLKEQLTKLKGTK